MAKLSVHDAVTKDLASIWDYIDEKSGSTEIADRVIETIQATFLELLNNPYLGNSYKTGILELEGLQRFLVQKYKFRYHIFFIREVDHIRVLYVCHHAQNIRDRMFEDLRAPLKTSE